MRINAQCVSPKCGVAVAMLLAFLLLLPMAILAADTPPPIASTPAPTNTTPSNAPSPHDVVQDTIDKVLKILADPGYKDSARQPALREQIRQTVLKVVDMDQVGAQTLAQYKAKFDEKQFRRFCDLFSRLVFTTYISHMEKYNGQKVIVLNTENKAEDRVLVHTKTLDETGDIPVDYALRRTNGVWKLYDVHIEGVSLVQNYRSQFGEILVNKKPDQLNDQIEAKVKQNEENMQNNVTPAPDLVAPKKGETK